MYIRNLNKSLIEAGFIEKKKTYKQIMAEMRNNKKTDKEYFLENQERLKKVHKCNTNKNLEKL